MYSVLIRSRVDSAIAADRYLDEILEGMHGILSRLSNASLQHQGEGGADFEAIRKTKESVKRALQRLRQELLAIEEYSINQEVSEDYNKIMHRNALRAQVRDADQEIQKLAHALRLLQQDLNIMTM
jgi:hypothetical protein